jgi:hypothetical protein
MTFPNSRFTARYGSPTSRTCSTDGCARQAKNLAGRCDRCINRLRRFGHVLQELPDIYTLDPAIRRMEQARGRLKGLDLMALEARWIELVADCRGRATPTYKATMRLSHNQWETEASALIRDLGEAVTFTRALDLLGAAFLIQIERPQSFRSEEAFQCCVVELFRRAAGGHVGRRVAAMREENGTIRRSYRKEVARQTRLAAFRYLNVGLGAAAAALAKREAAREEQARETRAHYYDAVRAIEAAVAEPETTN